MAIAALPGSYQASVCASLRSLVFPTDIRISGCRMAQDLGLHRNHQLYRTHIDPEEMEDGLRAFMGSESILQLWFIQVGSSSLCLCAQSIALTRSSPLGWADQCLFEKKTQTRSK